MMKHHEYAAFQGTHPFWMVANSQNTTPRARKVSEESCKVKLKKVEAAFCNIAKKAPARQPLLDRNRAVWLGPTELRDLQSSLRELLQSCAAARSASIKYECKGPPGDWMQSRSASGGRRRRRRIDRSRGVLSEQIGISSKQCISALSGCLQIPGPGSGGDSLR